MYTLLTTRVIDKIFNKTVAKFLSALNTTTKECLRPDRVLSSVDLSRRTLIWCYDDCPRSQGRTFQKPVLSVFIHGLNFTELDTR